MVYQQFIFDSSASADANSPTFNIFRSPYVAKFKILTAQVPTTFHSTGRQNNIVAIRENGTVRYVVLPYGDFTAVTFPGMLQTALGAGYTVTYDESQRNVKIENATVDFSILGLDGGSTAYSQLGAKRVGESPTSHTFQGGVSDFTGTSSLLLVSSELLTQDVIYCANASLNVIALVELHSPQGSYVHWENPANWLTMGANLSYCKFRFLDSKTLNEVDFRGAPFTIQLAVLTGEDDETLY
jgi:hypothetical protein